jgi:hypothetical protein
MDMSALVTCTTFKLSLYPLRRDRPPQNLTVLIGIGYHPRDGHQGSRIDALPLARRRLLRLRHL